MAGISSKAAGKLENKKNKFQNQEYNDDLGVDIYEFKYRMDDPQTGRFWHIDPLASDYVYNSTYAFSENKVIGHIELEGLECIDVNMETRRGMSQGDPTMTAAKQNNLMKAYDKGQAEGGRIGGGVIKVAGIGVLMVVQPEIGIPLALTDLTGIPVLPSPQAMAGVIVEEEAGALLGGRKGDMPTASAIDRHEIPSAKSMKDGLGVNTNDVPAVQLPTEIHAKTATFGNRPGAAAARATETALIKNGNIGQAFTNGVQDVQKVVNSAQGQMILKAAGLKTADVNKAINMMTEYFKKTF